MNSHGPLDQVFILRFWRESADAGEDARWRAMVRNINTRRRDVVDDVERAFAIVASNLDAAAGGPDGPGEQDGPGGQTHESTKND